MPAFFWLLASSHPFQAPVPVHTLPACCIHGCLLWCHAPGLACSRAGHTDLNTRGWWSGNQWSIRQIIDNLGDDPTPTAVTENFLLTLVGDGFSALFPKCCMISICKCWLLVTVCCGVCRDLSNIYTINLIKVLYQVFWRVGLLSILPDLLEACGLAYIRTYTRQFHC